MYHRPEIEAVIVGAGPAGLYSAISLAERGVPLRIYDEEWQTASRSYALALHPSTLTLLDEMDLADRVITHGVRIDRVAFYEGAERVGELDLAKLRLGHPFALVLPQSALEDVLEERLKASGASVTWNHRLCGLTQRDDQIFARIGRLAPGAHSLDRRASEWVVEESVQIHPRFLLGADGHRSAVRDLLQIAYDAAGPEERYLVFEFDCDWHPDSEVRIVLDEDTASVLWPLPGGRVRWSFGLSEDEGTARRRRKKRIEARPAGGAFPEPTAQLLAELLEERAPWFEGRPGELHWSTTVPFTPHLAESFGREHVWLVGDSAHQTGPIGVQSMNAAFREARDLVTRLEAVLLDRSDLGTLSEWEAIHRKEWHRLLGREGGPDVGPDAPDWVRRNAPRLVSCLPGSGDDLSRLGEALGLGIRRTSGLLR
jgi:2-polyprenyl-6-methoxyphenol hydroxylase-like FAD-dependent oxidoreductase